MIVCHCNVIHCREIRQATQSHIESGGESAMTTGRVFKALGLKPNCGQCACTMTAIIREAHADLQQECTVCDCPAEELKAAAE